MGCADLVTGLADRSIVIANGVLEGTGYTNVLEGAATLLTKGPSGGRA